MFKKLQMDWKIDPDGRQDRKSGPVVEYKLTLEELAKYNTVKVEPEKQPSMIGVEYLKRGEKKDMEEVAKYEVKKLTKVEVLRLTAEGKTVDEITEMY